MSGIHPETRFPPSLDADVAAMNSEFLALLTSPAQVSGQDLLGLDASIIDALRKLSDAQLEHFAGAPVLLAEFLPATAIPDVAGEIGYRVAESDLMTAWERQRYGFANQLFATLWQMSRQQHALTHLCLGIDKALAEQFARQNFSAVHAAARTAHLRLHARLATHPDSWTDLLRAVISGDTNQIRIAQLSMIPVTMANAFVDVA